MLAKKSNVCGYGDVVKRNCSHLEVLDLLLQLLKLIQFALQAAMDGFEVKN
jgi:S-adenosylhomocysteine hydrolase